MNKHTYYPAVEKTDSKFKTALMAAATFALFAGVGVMMAWRG